MRMNRALYVYVGAPDDDKDVLRYPYASDDDILGHQCVRKELERHEQALAPERLERELIVADYEQTLIDLAAEREKTHRLKGESNCNALASDGFQSRLIECEEKLAAERERGETFRQNAVEWDRLREQAKADLAAANKRAERAEADYRSITIREDLLIVSADTHRAEVERLRGFVEYWSKARTGQLGIDGKDLGLTKDMYIRLDDVVDGALAILKGTK